MLPLVVRVEDLDTKTSVAHIFRTSPVHIGRNNLNELPLPQPFVSMWHGMLRFDEASVEYVDLASTNGTEIDGLRVRENVFVSIERQTDLRIGSLRLHVAREADDSVVAPRQDQTLFQLRASVLRAVPSALRPVAKPAPQPPAPAKPAAEDPFAGIAADLSTLYTSYRQAWGAVRDQLAASLSKVPEKNKADLLASLARRMPALQQEEQFRALATSFAASSPASPSLGASALSPGEATEVVEPGELWAMVEALESSPDSPGRAAASSAAGGQVGGDALSLLRVFAHTYGSAHLALRSSRDVERLLNQIARVLETFSKAFIELRRGVDEFIEQMAVRGGGTLAPLRKAKTPGGVLRHLLDVESEAEGGERLQELTSGFAEVMIHQVALLSGLREGIRALLSKFSPGQLQQAAGNQVQEISSIGSLVRLMTGNLRGRVWPFRVFHLWKQYLQRYAQLAEEEQQLQSVVFGAEFAHAYVLMVSGRPPEPGDADVAPEPVQKAKRSGNSHARRR